MDKNSIEYKTCVSILNEELIPAMGCTEPIALAYAAAKCREILGEKPERVTLKVSGSIIKNVKSVIVPNTGHMKGIAAAISAGIVAGKAAKKLEVLSEVSQDEIAQIKEFAKNIPIDIVHFEDGHVFDIIITEYCRANSVTVRISDYHTNITLIEKNGEVLYEQGKEYELQEMITDIEILSIESIWNFAMAVDIEDVKGVLERQISCNCAIADEGLNGDYGANIGKVIIQSGKENVTIRAKAKAAAGSDARMNGCEMPVIINSGSGNQGITCSVPVVIYAEEVGASREQLLRALVISNLTAIHEKRGIGTLSAYCGAVSAGVGAAAGISYLLGGNYDYYKHTVSNALAIASGIVCDGAKASCAAKIAVALDSAFLAYEMVINDQIFKGGDGIVASDVERTINNIGRLGRDGMKQTNNVIIDIMIKNDYQQM